MIKIMADMTELSAIKKLLLNSLDLNRTYEIMGNINTGNLKQMIKI